MGCNQSSPNNEPVVLDRIPALALDPEQPSIVPAQPSPTSQINKEILVRENSGDPLKSVHTVTTRATPQKEQVKVVSSSQERIPTSNPTDQDASQALAAISEISSSEPPQPEQKPYNCFEDEEPAGIEVL